jgi:hypothetical protein
METQYYIYALDTEKGLITAALSCSDERTAKRAYLSARRKMETENCSFSSFHFNYCVVNAICTIKYQKFNGWNVEAGFERSDFEDAETVTKDNIPKFEKKYSYHDSNDWECYPADILFMRHVQSALSAIFLGFDPQDILSEEEVPPAEKQIPPWKRITAANVDSDTDASPVPTIAASGQGNPVSGMTAAEEAYQASIEWTDAPAEVNVNNPKEISDPIVEAVDKLTEHLVKVFPIDGSNESLRVEHVPESATKSKNQTLTPPQPKMDLEKIVAGIYETRPETKSYDSARFLAYLSDWAREQGVELNITDSSRIRKLQVWKDNKRFRESGSTRYGYNSENIKAVYDPDFDDEQ